MVTLANAVREFFKKLFFQISAVRTGVRAYMDATPLYFCFSLILGYRLFNFLDSAQKNGAVFWLIRRNTDGY